MLDVEGHGRLGREKKVIVSRELCRALMSDVGGPSKGWMRKGEEGCCIETAM
jgi:hypothetical protein